MEVVNYWPTGK